jgi:RHH-type proline utilization regulon transcriptional repressor/proline dehydrogenase/delta 1-pyrroline-5-carboxylate dehydrogenase
MTDEQLIGESSALAEALMGRARELGGPVQRRRQRRLRRLLSSPSGARLVFSLADRALRPFDAATAAAQLQQIASGPLEGLSGTDAALLHLAAAASTAAPFPVITLVGERLRYETRGLILPAEAAPLGRRLAKMRASGHRPNVNLLGEAVLGGTEAARRAAAVEALLRRPDVDCVSVKASAVAAGLSLVDFEGSVARLVRPLRALYRAAAAHRPAKLVNLDMEEHRDLDMTVEAFAEALRAEDLSGLSAGIALQAYLPDTHGALTRVLEVAGERAKSGGAPVRVRLVKGANLAMERATSELAGWPQAPYSTKAETDASYKALLERLLKAASDGTVTVGVASHNLFDVAFALVLAGHIGAEVEVEMLAGMADEQAAAVAERTGRVLLYTPVVRRADFRNALAYLARRLDENTTPEGFLRHALDLEPGSSAWEEQAERFAAAVRSRHRVRTRPNHEQDRSEAKTDLPSRTGPGFANEPPTDFTLLANRKWALAVLAKPRPAAPREGGSEEEVDAVVARACCAWRDWEELGPANRGALLVSAAEAMAAGRGEVCAAMATEAGKILEEADTEASEGVDYARWYGAGRGSLQHLLEEVNGEAESSPLGAVVVAPPWNFPYAIPAGGTLAALAAGNSVILKPAPEAPAVAQLIAGQLLSAGVPQGVLQFFPVADGKLGRRLIAHRGVGGVVLTGSYETARRFARWAPERRVLAETSGKNSVVVSATADVDEAVRDLVASAFGHAGQKCSAASLGIVVASVYDRSPFLRQLEDAVRSLRVGPANDPATQVGPLTGPFTPALRRALTELSPGESWLVEPRCLDDPEGKEGRLWSPGVRLGVAPGSWAHMTEWFGPVLGLMRARDLKEALEWQNAVPYGLTAGLFSLDPVEHRRWAEAVEAGNAYINRTTTGAIVGRQPFGGWKRSSYGPTAKAGGLNYLVGLRRWRDPHDVSLAGALASYRYWWERHFAVRTELAGLRSESNELLYRSFSPGVIVRAGSGTDPSQLAKALALSQLTGTPVTFSLSFPVPGLDSAHVVVESDESFAAAIRGGISDGGGNSAGTSDGGGNSRGNRGGIANSGSGLEGKRLRLLGSTSPEVYEAAVAAGLSVLDEPVCSCGRIELVRWLREKVVTRSLHRYGNIVY